jgi:2-methylisocitrate lyase-like PEP mutase family enzyme
VTTRRPKRFPIRSILLGIGSSNEKSAASRESDAVELDLAVTDVVFERGFVRHALDALIVVIVFVVVFFFVSLVGQLLQSGGELPGLVDGGIANTFFGVPDIGLVTVSELAAHVAAIREAFPGPLVVDADTGFGNAVNVVRTVSLLERAGADALQIEDQVFPKRCGHFAGKHVIATAEMVEKIKAAVDTRRDGDLLIIARTDAIAPEGYAAAIERAAAYREAGADVTFVEAPTSMEEIADIPRRLPWPQLLNIVLGGRTPQLPNEKLKELGYAGVIYANVALQSALKGMQAALGELRRKGYMGNAMELVMDFSERQRLVHKDEFDALERKYVTKD